MARMRERDGENARKIEYDDDNATVRRRQCESNIVLSPSYHCILAIAFSQSRHHIAELS
ncbi:hypothetical protein DPMN_007876 [Dreissena polymorpha]|uniref:Uncharacterized protein n=1 Tax=Dreissena polymorpha TaxID=45954 RepID=A0A9D4MUC2_DREPO|nr:hypothetical protein DPMN_007876 [Dreissena polymorpha]